MERSLNADFSSVRLHQGPEAAQLNRQLGAHAFTAGSDVFFGATAPALSTGSGQHMLAHELTHVLQNRVAPSAAIMTVGSAADPAEHEAEQTARRVMATRAAPSPAHDAAPAHDVHDASPATVATAPLRRAYADLDDNDREAVDLEAGDDFAIASAEFEQRLGRIAARDPRAQSAASLLLNRALKLAEDNFVRDNVQGELADHLADTFGIKDRKDFTGTVGAGLGMIMEVFREGTFREKMSMFYVAMAERQSLGPLLNSYVVNLVKSGTGGTGGSSSPKVVANTSGPAKSGPDPTTVGSKTPSTSAKADFGDYAPKQQRKQQFKRLVEFVISEIDLERHIRVRSSGLVPSKQSAEDMAAQREADQQMASAVIETVTGGTMVGDETTKSDKKTLLRDEVRKELTARDGAGVDTERGPLVQEFTRHATRQTQGLGWIELQYGKPFADNSTWLDPAIKAVANSDASVDGIRAELKSMVVEKVFQDLLIAGGVPFGAPSVSPLQALLDAELKTYQATPNLARVVAAVTAETKLTEANTPTNHVPETLARKQFNINLPANHTLLATKKGLDRARQGTGREENTSDKQLTDQSAADIEQEGGDPLTYRELGAAFYTPKEFTKVRQASKKAYRAKMKLGRDAPMPKEWQEEFRLELMKLHGTTKLPWKPGGKFWKLDPKSEFVQTAQKMRVQVAAGLSGTTDRVMRAASLLGLKGTELEDVLLACLGWMLPARDHSYYEILKAAEPYLKIKPATHLAEPLIDAQYANGYGYRKMLDYFPNLGELPDVKLSVEYKDQLAKKLEKPTVEGSGESGAKAKVNLTKAMSIQSSVTAANALVGQTTTFTVRNAPGGRRLEWFVIREGTNAARAVPIGAGPTLDRTFKHPGLYKLYCLVHDRDAPDAKPVATLRYDQTVVAEKSKDVDKSPVKADLVTVTATFTDLEGIVNPIPVQAEAAMHSDGRTVVARLTVPDSLPGRAESRSKPLVLEGRATNPNATVAKTETATMFNKIYRKPKDPRLVQAEAVQAAARNWEKASFAVLAAGSVNVNVLDAATEEILREHFFAVDKKGSAGVDLKGSGAKVGGDSGAKVGPPEPTRVPAYRVQGGDFALGISSSVRLVDTQDDKVGISGNAAVWVNFTDKARMIWWLSNRSDGSYSVAFSVTPGFLEEVRKLAVPESDSNLPANKGKGKPIISQDKAAYQYAIARPVPSAPEPKPPSLEDMAAAVIGEIVKVFQWKTFDIAADTKGDLPTGEGRLAQQFNAALQQANDLELKMRFLKNMPLEETQIAKYEKFLAQQLEPKSTASHVSASSDLGERKKNLESRWAEHAAGKRKEGATKWEEDYRYTLRKPGGAVVSEKKKDRRLVSELSSTELTTKQVEIASEVERECKTIVGRELAQLHKSKLKDVIKDRANPKVVDPFVVAVKSAMDRINALLNEQRAARMADLPKKLWDNICEKVRSAAGNQLTSNLTPYLAGTELTEKVAELTALILP